MTREGVWREKMIIISAKPIFRPNFSVGKLRSIVFEILWIVEGKVFLILMVEKYHDTPT